MGKHLAKLPQQRVRAPENHPTVKKLEKLFDYMDALGLEFYFDIDRISVIDTARPNDIEWEIRDIINSDFLLEMPCDPGEYKLTRTTDISPRQAQPAPEYPGLNSPASGLNHFKIKQKKPKKQPIASASIKTTPQAKIISRGKK